MPTRSWILLFILFIACAACSSVPPADWTREPAELSRHPTQSVYVCVPANRSYETEANSHSGRQAVAAIATALRARVSRVGMSSDHVVGDEALDEARAQNYQQLLYPTILHWEERNTQWSGKLDRVRLRLDLYDVPSGRVLASTAFSLEGAAGHVEDLLEPPLEEYVEAVF